MSITFEPYELRPVCGTYRAVKGKVQCELPPDHDDEHLGRDSAGRWHGWRDR